MMDAEGRVGGGTVSRDLTVVDPAAPGGRRMDPAAVLDAFDAAWSGPDASDAVLVEMSDLERAERDGLPLTGPERAAGPRQPLAAGRRDARASCCSGSTSQRDRVIVVSPAAPGGYGRLTVFGLAGRGVEPGLARSATTRRDGYVTLPDVGATVLDSLGLAAARQHELDADHLQRRRAASTPTWPPTSPSPTRSPASATGPSGRSASSTSSCRSSPTA